MPLTRSGTFFRAVAGAAVVAALTGTPIDADGLEGELKKNCRDDAILVFDASGSMAGTDMNSVTPHIKKVRDALADVLPSIAPLRNLGLATYGPGPWGRCNNIELAVAPQPNAAEPILDAVNAIVPGGETPLSRSVELAAEALTYRDKPATIVLFTDGEENCGGDPCATARRLRENGKDLTVHVVGLRTPVSVTLGMGMLETRCFADETGGTVTTVETREEIIRAFHETLGCPYVTQLPLSPVARARSLE